MNKVIEKIRKIVVEKIVKSDGSDNAIIPMRGFVLTIIFFSAFVAQLLLGLWSFYLSHIVWMADSKLEWMEAAHIPDKMCFLRYLVELICGPLTI